ncbi:MAG: septum formation initiator family protein [Bacteroidales bacterium]|nr:septum formation initiator family protein [Bacteroidales bacterium]
MSLKQRFSKLIKNKYFITILVFMIWVLFFDKNNLLDRLRKINELNQLEKDRVYYQEWIENDKNRMNELRTSKDNLEKFAREEYYMKADNEDVFIIVEEN